MAIETNLAYLPSIVHSKEAVFVVQLPPVDNEALLPSVRYAV